MPFSESIRFYNTAAQDCITHHPHLINRSSFSLTFWYNFLLLCLVPVGFLLSQWSIVFGFYDKYRGKHKCAKKLY